MISLLDLKIEIRSIDNTLQYGINRKAEIWMRSDGFVHDIYFDIHLKMMPDRVSHLFVTCGVLHNETM